MEAGPAEHVVAHERGEASDVRLAHIEVLRPQPIHRGVHIAGVEQHQGVEDQAERADRVPHAVVIVLVELSGPAVEDHPGQGVAALLQIGLRLDLPAVARFVGQAQDVQGLGDPPVVGDGVA